MTRRAHRQERNLRGRLAAPAVLAVCGALALVFSAQAAAAPNGYTQVTLIYAATGCYTWNYPGELSGDVTVTAVGAAGATAQTNGEIGDSGGSGGFGDEVTGSIGGLESPTQSLYVCVNEGGGTAGPGTTPPDDGGAGGGASGVSYGTDFSEPLVLAAGGGGGGAGPSASPGGWVGEPGTGVPEEAMGGGGASGGTYGAGGAGAFTGGKGAQFTAAGPGQGGAGASNIGLFGAGGGGGGYDGGGGGGTGPSAGAGGGGGSDFCAGAGPYGISIAVFCTGSTGAGTSTSSGTASGEAMVELSYLVFSGFTTTTSTTVDDGSGQAFSSSGELGGNSAYDTASVSGAVAPFAVDGTLTYDFYNNGACTGIPQSMQTVSVGDTGTAVNSSSTGALSPGNYSFSATYNGSSYYAASSPSSCEPFTLNKATPAIATTQQPASANVGNSIADKATVSAGSSPTGTVTFVLYSTSAGTGTPLFTDTETLSGGVTTSKGFTATTPGTDYWVATYNGDANNASVSSATNAEPVTIKAPTSLKAAPQLVLFEPFVGIGNQLVQATLTSAGVPVVGQTVYFSDGPLQLCHANTNAKGVARCAISSFDQVLVNRSNQYTATFTATAGYSGSTSTVPATTFFWA
jgi:hypothetical protein